MENNKLSKYKIELGDYVMLNERGINELFRDNINTVLYGIVTNIDENGITYEDSETGMIKKCDDYWLRKGAPDDRFWYAVATVFSNKKKSSLFKEEMEKYPQLVDYYEKIEEEYLDNDDVEQSIQSEYYKKFEKYIYTDKLAAFDLDSFNEKMNDHDNFTSNEIQNIAIGNSVIFNDQALTNSFISNIDKPLWGEVTNIESSGNNNFTITYIEPETQETNIFNARYLKKGTPDKEFIYKILTIVDNLEHDKSEYIKAQFENIKMIHPLQLSQLLKLRSKYLPSYVEQRKIEEREKNIHLFFKSKLSTFFQGDTLEKKVTEARELLNLIYEFTNNEYKDNDILLLCNHVISTYEYDNNNKDVRQPLNASERFIYAISEEFVYDKLSKKPISDIDTQIIFDELLKQLPINMNKTIAKDAIAISIDKFKKNYYNDSEIRII